MLVKPLGLGASNNPSIMDLQQVTGLDKKLGSVTTRKINIYSFVFLILWFSSNNYVRAQ